MPYPIYPPAVIFINIDLVPEVQAVFTRQLFLTAIMDAATFDANVAANPNYPASIHQQDERIMVLRDLQDQTNRQFADVVFFAKGGMVSILANKFGPPGKTLGIDRLYWNNIVLGPVQGTCCPPSCYPCFIKDCYCHKKVPIQ